MTKRTLRVVHYAEDDDSEDENAYLSLKRSSRLRQRTTRNANVHNGRNSDDEFDPNVNGRSVSRSRSRRRRRRRSSVFEQSYRSTRQHSQSEANRLKTKRQSIRRSRSSLQSLGLDEEDGTSLEEDDDDISALATSQRRRSASRESFSDMLIRRSSRPKKSLHKTLNLSTIENEAMISEEAESAPNEHHVASKENETQSIKPELRDLLIAQGKSPRDAEAFTTPDIYTSIKSRQRHRKPKKFFDDDLTEPTAQSQDDSEIKDQADKNEKEDTGSDAKNKKTPDVKNEESDDDDDKEEDETDEESSEEDESEEDSDHVTRRKYSLRKRRVKPARLVDEIRRQTRRPSDRIFDRVSTSLSRLHKHRSKRNLLQNSASPYQQRERRTYSQGASSTSSSSDANQDADERNFERRKNKSMAKARNRCLPMNLSVHDLSKHGFANERRKIGSSLADVDPMNIDKTIKFDSVGGHRKHVRALKEMVVFPLMYPEVFQKFHINPPRGCLFYGPPGTGKTLMARALANECSTEGRKVAFFMRKGADCLSKWVGESERQLRLLFDQAYQMRPSIIFFDEIDGLAPVRSSKQDQIHSSIVSTLLGLMDGLDSRGEIIVIGATNRIDSIDPALRRPGRFDREFPFFLPDKKARKEILTIHTKKWNPPLEAVVIEELAEKTSGYCGADIMALCAESALFALRRRYPQIYSSSDKLKLNLDEINVQSADFHKAMKSIVPTGQRSATNPSRALPTTLRPLLINTLHSALIQLARLFPLIKKRSKLLETNSAERESRASHVTEVSESESEFEEEEAHSRFSFPLNGISVPSPISNFVFRESKINRPRFMICGSKGDGHTSHLAPALLYDLEGIPVHLLDIPVLYDTSTRTPEEACAQIFREALRSAPSIIYLPNATTWWDSTSTTVHHTFKSLLRNVPSNTPVLLIATANCPYSELPVNLKRIFRRQNSKILTMTPPTVDERVKFFSPLFLQLAVKKPINKERKKLQSREVLEKVSSVPTTELTSEEIEKIELQEESIMRNLRLFLRDVLTRLAQDRRFKVFLEPVDTEEVSDYAEVINEPMDLSTMMIKIDQHRYSSVASFVYDVNLICSNALDYNPDHSAEDRAIRHRACLLKDMAHTMIQEQLEPSFERLCNEVIEARKRRNADPLKFAPTNIAVPPKRRKANGDNQGSNDGNGDGGKRRARAYKLELTRKRRRPSAWASGVIRKYKKKARIDDDSEDDKDVKTDDISENEEVDIEVERHQSEDAVEEKKSEREDEDHNDGDQKDASDDDDDDDAKGQPISEEEKNQSDASNTSHNDSKNLPSVKEDGEASSSSSEDEKNKGPRTPPEHPSSRDSSASSVEEEKLESPDESAPENHPSSLDVPASDNDNKELEGASETLREVKTEMVSEEEEPKHSSTPEEKSVKQEEIELPPSPPLVVDEQKLKYLLYHTVQITSRVRLEDLESLYSILVRCVYRHNNDYDKTLLLQEFEKEVQLFMKNFDEDLDGL